MLAIRNRSFTSVPSSRNATISRSVSKAVRVVPNRFLIIHCESKLQAALNIQQAGRYQVDPFAFDEGAAEIVAHDASLQRLFVVNSDAKTVDVLDIADPANIQLLGQIDATTDTNEIVRLFDGAENPIGKAYSQKEFKAMLEPYFTIEQTFLHFFPARSLPIPVPKVLHRALDGTLGFMIYAFLTKK